MLILLLVFVINANTLPSSWHIPVLLRGRSCQADPGSWSHRLPPLSETLSASPHRDRWRRNHDVPLWPVARGTELSMECTVHLNVLVRHNTSIFLSLSCFLRVWRDSTPGSVWLVLWWRESCSDGRRRTPWLYRFAGELKRAERL